MKNVNKFLIVTATLGLIASNVRGATTETTKSYGETSTMETTSAPKATTKSTTTTSTTTVGTPQDIEVTRMIREELSSNDDLSVAAKNVEVVTVGNTVTLRGKVASEVEKQTVATTAKNAAGTRAIRNELKVDTSAR